MKIETINDLLARDDVLRAVEVAAQYEYAAIVAGVLAGIVAACAVAIVRSEWFADAMANDTTENEGL